MAVKKGSRRAQAQPFLTKLAAEGIAANEALRQLKEAGMGYRRTDFLADYRKVTGAEKAKDYAKHIRKDYYPTSAVITPTELNLKRKYHNYVNYSVFDTILEQEVNKTLIIASDKPQTIRYIEGAAADIISDNLDAYESEIRKLTYAGTRERID